MDTTLMLLLIALLGLATWALWRLHAQVEDLRLDVEEIHCTLVEIALSDEDATGDAEWHFDITEMNGVVHE